MHEKFNKEINYIKDNDIKNSLITILDLLPDYFYDIPASSTGKYHPEFTLGKGGLVRHTKVAVRLAVELFNDSALNNFTQHEKDLIIFLLISKFLKDNKDKLSINKNDIDFICECVETHMGPWTKDYDGNEVLKPPVNKYQRFVHMCDYLASRKFLNVKFLDDEIIE